MLPQQPKGRNALSALSPAGSIVRVRRTGHIWNVAPEPAIQVSEELAVLIRRAEGATAAARQLIDENDRWRQSVMRQLNYMFEISAEFRKPSVIRSPASPDRPAAADK